MEGDKVELPEGKRLIIVANQMPVTISPHNPTSPRSVASPTSARGLDRNSSYVESKNPTPPLETIADKWDIHACQGGSSGILTASTAFDTHSFSTLSVGTLQGDFSPAEQAGITSHLEGNHNCSPVFIPSTLYTKYYRECCKKMMWPFMHLLESSGATVAFDNEAWQAYVGVNQMIADSIAKLLNPGDVVWIQDYHLMLVPRMLREQVGNDTVIGFFLHTPWPPSELYRRLPVRQELLEGLIHGPNLIGFQTYDYARQFSNTCMRILGAVVDTTDPGGITVKERNSGAVNWVAIGIYPVGLDTQHVHQVLQSEDCQRRIAKLAKTHEDKITIVGCDRLDVIKGLVHKINIFDMFLERHPEYIGQVELVQIAIPHEHQDPAYATEVSDAVLRVNGKYGSLLDYQPIQYLHRREPVESQLALFATGDVCFVTAVRDGMNMTSAEYVAVTGMSGKRPGAVVLSEFCGTASSLSGAFLINPWDYHGACDALYAAITMAENERKMKHQAMYDYITANNTFMWGDAFVRDLIKAANHNGDEASGLAHGAPVLDLDEVVNKFKEAKNPLFCLDYDGTLTPIVATPDLAHPPEINLSSLEKLSQREGCEVYVISGRDRTALNTWLGHLNIGFSAEHGSFLRKKGESEWTHENKDMSLAWQDSVLRVFEYYTARTPGSMIERKTETLTWHYRCADEEHGIRQARELCNHLENTVVTEYNVEVLTGSKNIEVRPAGVNKGAVVRKVISLHRNSDFVLCAGDDHTDEDMFAELRTVSKIPSLFTVLVGSRATKAKFRVDGTKEIEDLLQRLADV